LTKTGSSHTILGVARTRHLSCKLLLPFGRGTVAAYVPDSAAILSGAGGIALPDADAAVRKGLEHPSGTAALHEIVRRKRPSCVSLVASDHTRASPSRVLIPPILEVLRAEGVPSPAVTILVATGTHRATTDEEKKELFGERVVETCRIVDHRCADPACLLPIQVNGQRCSVSRAYLESDLKILTGLVEPHFMAGFSGGRKAVCPGLAGMDTVRVFHGPEFLESPFAAAGVLRNNPCHLFATRCAQVAGVDFIVNATIDRNGQVTGVFCGEMRQAFLAGVRQCRRQCQVACSEKYDIVITTNGGYPLDRDFYQTVKGLVNCLPVLRKGGTILCASECADGLGSENFRFLLAHATDPEAFLRRISAPDFFQHDQWEVEELMKVLRVARVRLFSTLSPSDARTAHAEPIESIQEGIEQTLAEYGPSASVAVIPDGPYTLLTAQT